MTVIHPACEFPPFLASEVLPCPLAEAFFSVLPVPYEASVSYGGGTAKGPAAILQASSQLELWDGQSKPGELGIHTGEAVDCSDEPEQVMQRIAARVAEIVSANAMPVVLGGEHAVTGGVIEGLLQAGMSDFGVVQIDAHADLRAAYEGNPLSHASVMHRVVEKGIPLYQLGVRAYCEEEMAVRQQYGVQYQDAKALVTEGVTQIRLPDDFPAKVFFTLDIDGLDPSVFPATGTPVPGGLGWYQSLSLFESVASQRQIIGFDVVEVAPIEGFHAYDFAAAHLIYQLMGIVQRHRGK